MKKFVSLLKAIMSQDMNLFRYKSSKKEGLSKFVLPIVLTVLVMFSMGTMYYSVAFELDKVNLTHIVLSIGIFLPSILLLMEGVYKSQGILFEAKDSDLLFSLPISKRKVLLARIIKLYVFQLLYSMLFVLPAIIVYCILKHPNAYFYFITSIMFLLIPIIPTISACFIGFLIKKVSVSFKHKRAVEIVLTFIIFLGIMSVSMKSSEFLSELVQNAEGINETAKLLYYPLAAYMELISNFNILTFLLLLGINAILVVLFVLFVSKTYQNVVSKVKINNSILNDKKDVESKISFKPKNTLISLIKKEFSRYFSSTVYIFNTLFGLVLLVLATVSLCTNFNESLNAISSEEIGDIDLILLHTLASKIFLVVVIATSFLTSITSSSISLEGKSFNISKSLPVKTDTLLLAKVMMSNIITIPVIIICDFIFFTYFDVLVIDKISIIISSFVAPSIAAVFGLLVNLKFPKMNATSDSEVVKQSTSSMVSVLCGILFSGIFLGLTFFVAAIGDFAILLEVLLLVICLVILWLCLVRYGRRRYREIEI